MKRILAVFFVVFTSLSVTADPVTNSIEIAKLTEMIKSLNDTLKVAQDTLEIQRQLAEFEQLEAVKQISQGGQDLWELANEISTTRSLLDGFESPKKQLDRLRNDIAAYVALYEHASTEDGIINSLRAYASALAQLEDQYWTGTPYPDVERNKEFSVLFNRMNDIAVIKQSQESNTLEIAGGLNASEAAVVSATDLNALLKLQIQQNALILEQQAKAAEMGAQQDIFFSSLLYQGVGDE